MTVSILPESAPFNEEQRAWLNGFFAGMIGIEEGGALSRFFGTVAQSWWGLPAVMAVLAVADTHLNICAVES